MLLADPQPFRVVDVAGLYVAMVLGLVLLAYFRQVRDGIVVFVWRRAGSDDPLLAVRRFMATVIVLVVGITLAAGSALMLMGVLLPRPGHYPGGVLDTVLAVVALIALAALLGRHLRAALSHRSTYPHEP